MKLHGEEIRVGDRVYDISYNRGYGRVYMIQNGTIHVDFGHSRIPFTENGVQSRKINPTLYWDIPVIIKPKKNEKSWVERNKLYSDMFKLIDSYNNIKPNQ